MGFYALKLQIQAREYLNEIKKSSSNILAKEKTQKITNKDLDLDLAFVKKSFII